MVQYNMPRITTENPIHSHQIEKSGICTDVTKKASNEYGNILNPYLNAFIVRISNMGLRSLLLIRPKVNLWYKLIVSSIHHSVQFTIIIWRGFVK